MSKARRWILLCGLLLLGGDLAALGEDARLTERFAGNVRERWELDPGWGVAEDPAGNPVLHGRGHSWARLRAGQTWSDYRFRFRLRLVKGTIHVNFRVGEEGRYFIGLREDGAYLHRESPWGTFTELAPGARIGLGPGAWYPVQVVGKDGRLEVFVGGERQDPSVLRQVISSPLDPQPPHRGSIAFETLDGAEAYIDDLVVDIETPPSPVVRRVEPGRLEPGTEVRLGVSGRHFLPRASVEIGGPGVVVHGVEVLGSENLEADLEVSEEAAAGWREVVVTNPDGQSGSRRRALQVVAPAPAPVPPPRPTPPPQDGSPWVWAGAALLLLGLGVALGRILKPRAPLAWNRTAQLQWQLEAKTELPEAREVCTWACQAQVTANLGKRWKVTALQLTPLPRPSGETPPVKRVEGEILGRLTESAQLQHALEDEARTRQRVSPVVDALLEQILAWREEGMTPASIKVDAHLARDVKCKFRLHHCEEKDGKPTWVDSGVGWKGTLHQPGGDCLGVLRGPAAGEPDFAARVREELAGFLLQLIQGVRFKL